MTPAEAGSKGGRVTRDRHGAEFFRRIGRIGGSRPGAPQQRRAATHDRTDDQTSAGDEPQRADESQRA